MSQWTHLCGNVRYDYLPLKKDLTKEEMKEVVGHTCDFNDPEEVWKKCDVPRGSEGSLHWFVEKNPHESSLARFSVGIWGDLRDFGEEEDIEKVRKWFRKIVIEEPKEVNLLSVRQAVLEIDNGDKIILVYYGEDYMNEKEERIHEFFIPLEKK